MWAMWRMCSKRSHVMLETESVAPHIGPSRISGVSFRGCGSTTPVDISFECMPQGSAPLSFMVPIEFTNPHFLHPPRGCWLVLALLLFLLARWVNLSIVDSHLFLLG